ncbi:hypothetical protein ACF07V_17605 [Streptomyces sp. NPDC015661]|uniref:hypothetical protein n=1 Tax=Streptomyces sp. NPDC015661 TaxID=3364961 RepID=UPI0036F6F5C9
MKIMKTGLSACAVAALLTGTVACTSESGGTAPRPTHAAATATPTATACAGGTYTWFNVDTREVLTGLAEKQKLGKGGGRLTHTVSPLHTPLTAVTFEKGPRVDPKATLHSLGARIGDPDAVDAEGYGFADVHRAAPKLDSKTATVLGAGTFVEYAYVRQVTGDFLYTCADGTRAAGRAIGWTTDGSGLLECSTPIEDMKADEAPREAALLSCGPGSAAARTKQG